MKKMVCLLLMGSAAFLMGNKGCPKNAPVEHPVLQKGMTCATCHDDGRTKETKPAGHDLAWEKNHGEWIRQNGFKSDSSCATCHTEAQCVRCHQQEPPKNHTNFWRLKGHGIAVGLDRGSCLTCHRGADFCQRCHSQTQPLDHTAAWGTPGNLHCQSCHFPITSAGGRGCAVCHTAGTPSHNNTPLKPSNALHGPGADCRSCHSPLRHPDNGMACTSCHAR